MQYAGGKVNTELANVVAACDTGADGLAQQYKGKDDDLKKALKDLFDKQNSILANKIKGIHDGLGGEAKTVNETVIGTVAVWMTQIAQATSTQKQMAPAPK